MKVNIVTLSTCVLMCHAIPSQGADQLAAIEHDYQKMLAAEKHDAKLRAEYQAWKDAIAARMREILRRQENQRSVTLSTLSVLLSRCPHLCPSLRPSHWTPNGSPMGMITALMR